MNVQIVAWYLNRWVEKWVVVEEEVVKNVSRDGGVDDDVQFRCLWGDIIDIMQLSHGTKYVQDTTVIITIIIIIVLPMATTKDNGMGNVT